MCRFKYDVGEGCPGTAGVPWAIVRDALVMGWAEKGKMNDEMSLREIEGKMMK